jgi:integrase
LVPVKERLWLQYNHQFKKFVRSPIGKKYIIKDTIKGSRNNRYVNKIKNIDILGKEKPEIYTGHSLRVSSATALADEGATTTNLKRHGGWKSEAIAESYVRDSKKVKAEVASMLSLNNTSTSSASASAPVSFANCVFNNCTINLKNSSPTNSQ